MPNNDAACVLVLCVEYCKQGILLTNMMQEMKLLLFEYEMRLLVRHYSLSRPLDTLAVYWFALVPLPPSIILPSMILYTHIQ